MSVTLVFFLVKYLDSKFNFLDKLPPPSTLKLIGLTLLILYISYKIFKYRSQKILAKGKISTKVATVEKSKETLERNLGDGKLLNEKREEILALSVSELIKSLQNGSLLCVDVLNAYQAKALEVSKELNCVTEFIKEAEEVAKKLDNNAQSKKGPLHGLPFSIKDNVGLIGYDCTVGITKFIDQPVEEDAAIVKALMNLGAIPFCKTNIPQTMLSFGCSNPIWGLTKNPYNKDRTPGGSSGGEACLVASGGSPFGIGSDIGGSARVPAAFCGISSIKPTSYRMSYKGFRKSARGCVGINATPGIMARDCETVTLISKLLLDQSYLQGFDPDILPIPWNDQLFETTNRKLRIGYYEEDGFFPTTPGVRRAINQSREHFEKLGHEMVPFSPSKVNEVFKNFVEILHADQSKNLLDALAYDDIDPVLKMSHLGMKLPYFFKKLVSPFLYLLAPRVIPSFLAAGSNKTHTSYNLWGAIGSRDTYKENFLSHWRSLNLDLCIAPSFSSPAPLSDDIGRLVAAGSYSLLYNYLDFPVGVVPVTKENEADQANLADYSHHDLICRLLKKTTTGATGMPIAVQVIGLPYKEELVLQGMSILESAVKDQI